MKTNQHRPDPKQGHQHLSCMANIGGRSMTSCERRTPRGRLRTTGGQRPHSFLFLREPPTINCTFFPLAANYIGPAWCYCLENIVVYIYIYSLPFSLPKCIAHRFYLFEDHQRATSRPRRPPRVRADSLARAETLARRQLPTVPHH